MNDNSSCNDGIQVTIFALGVIAGAIIYMVIRYS